MVDHLRITGGNWKEQRRRHLQSAIRQSIKIKQELEKMEKTVMQENAQIVKDYGEEDSTSESN